MYAQSEWFNQIKVRVSQVHYVAFVTHISLINNHLWSTLYAVLARSISLTLNERRKYREHSAVCFSPFSVLHTVVLLTLLAHSNIS